MQQMQAMHESMMAARTPAERQAQMSDRMKLMQQGMVMMTMLMQMMMDGQQMGVWVVWGESPWAECRWVVPPARQAQALPRSERMASCLALKFVPSPLSRCIQLGAP